jgi:hypothetical protein
MRGSLDRLDRDVQISLSIDLLDGRIQRPLAQVRPDRQRCFSDNLSISILTESSPSTVSRC